MKKISIMILLLVVAMASCKKTPEVNLKYVDVERDLITVGTTTATVQCDYQYIATLKKAYFYYGEGEDEADMNTAEMRVVQNTLYVDLAGLRENTTYSYYYEFHNGFNSMRTVAKTFKTEGSGVTITLPTVITAAVTEITINSAKGGGEVTNDGGAEVTERGICWGTNENPTLNDNHIAVGMGIGAFTAMMNGLEANTTYHVRAYAINEKGAAYGLDVEFTTLDGSSPIQLPVVVTNDVVGITAHSATCGGEVTNDGGTEVTERGICWSTNANPTLSDSHVAAGSGTGAFTAMMNGLEANTIYYVRAYATNEAGTAYGLDREFVTNGGCGCDYDYVDLGLPSGTLWATCNVGANLPEEYGDYFAWAETEPKTIFSWYTYKYSLYDGGLFPMITKYCNDSPMGYNGFTDTLTVLQPIDDAATVNWGADWHTPSKTQWDELYLNTTNTWINRNGINGILFTANNGNSLFLPAAGFYEYENIFNVSITGIYWANNLTPDNPTTSWSGGFAANDGYLMYHTHNRWAGANVRPVRFSN